MGIWLIIIFFMIVGGIVSNSLKNKFTEGKQNFSKEKISEAWKKYKEEGGALSNKEKN